MFPLGKSSRYTQNRIRLGRANRWKRTRSKYCTHFSRKQRGLFWFDTLRLKCRGLLAVPQEAMVVLTKVLLCWPPLAKRRHKRLVSHERERKRHGLLRYPTIYFELTDKVPFDGDPCLPLKCHQNAMKALSFNYRYNYGIFYFRDLFYNYLSFFKSDIILLEIFMTLRRYVILFFEIIFI